MAKEAEGPRRPRPSTRGASEPARAERDTCEAAELEQGLVQVALELSSDRATRWSSNTGTGIDESAPHAGNAAADMPVR